MLVILDLLTEKDDRKDEDFWREQKFVTVPEVMRPQSFLEVIGNAEGCFRGKRIAVPKMYVGGDDPRASTAGFSHLRACRRCGGSGRGRSPKPKAQVSTRISQWDVIAGHVGRWSAGCLACSSRSARCCPWHQARSQRWTLRQARPRSYGRAVISTSRLCRPHRNDLLISNICVSAWRQSLAARYGGAANCLTGSNTAMS